jgi:hypothetical protein
MADESDSGNAQATIERIQGADNGGAALDALAAGIDAVVQAVPDISVGALQAVVAHLADSSDEIGRPRITDTGCW